MIGEDSSVSADVVKVSWGDQATCHSFPGRPFHKVVAVATMCSFIEKIEMQNILEKFNIAWMAFNRL